MRRLMREISFVLEDREKGNWKNGKTQLKEEVNTEGKKKQIYHKGCVLKPLTISQGLLHTFVSIAILVSQKILVQIQFILQP